MLVIRRRAGQSITIGEDIEVRVTEVAGGRVKLAISAPKSVPVVRTEVKLTREQNMAAAHESALERWLAMAPKLPFGRTARARGSALAAGRPPEPEGNTPAK